MLKLTETDSMQWMTNELCGIKTDLKW